LVAETSPGGTRTPVSPSRTSSGTPPTRDATTQQPHDIASSSALGKLSVAEVSVKTSILRIQSATALVVGSK
jgi:hypothetical protein